jgi:hypothetical protein
MLLFRYFLIGLIIYLFIRSFIRFGEDAGEKRSAEPHNKKSKSSKRIPKEIGVYVDYEEVDE